MAPRMTAATATLEHGARLRAGRIALGGAFLVLALKLVAWRLTGSTAVLSDALESFVNVAAGAILLMSLTLAAEPADRNHPYGHGKVEFFSAGVEATLIAIAALLIGFEAIRALIAGPSIRQLDLGLALVSGATALNAGMGLYLIRVGRRVHSLALVADGRHLLTDVTTSVGVLIGLLAVRVTGVAMLDPLVALAVALQILVTAYRLGREAVRGLMDEADPAVLTEMVAALERRRAPWCIGVHSLRAWRSGAHEHVDLHVVVPRYFDADRLHAIDREVESIVLEGAGHPGEAILHFDPCRPHHCSGCIVEPCPVRSTPLAARSPLTLDAATSREDPIRDAASHEPMRGAG